MDTRNRDHANSPTAASASDRARYAVRFSARTRYTLAHALAHAGLATAAWLVAVIALGMGA